MVQMFHLGVEATPVFANPWLNIEKRPPLFFYFVSTTRSVIIYSVRGPTRSWTYGNDSNVVILANKKILLTRDRNSEKLLFRLSFCFKKIGQDRF